LVKPFLNRCLTANHIDQLRVAIDRYYIEKGWILARSYLLPNQNIKSGKLIFQVLEGHLDSIKLNENTLSDRMQVSTAFPFMVGEVLYIRDIEQGLEQMNRLASNQAKMDIVPVKDKPGYGQINIKTQHDNRYRYYLGFDNLGSESTGQEQGKLTADLDNLLSINDNLSITATQYAGGNTENKDSKSLTANLSFPLGYWTVNANSSHSSYLSTVSDTSGSFHLSGDSDTHKLKLSRVAHRDKTSKTNFGLELAHKANNSYLEDVRLDSSSRKLTVFTINVDHVIRKPGMIWSYSVDYTRGLDLFDAVEDGPVRDDNIPRAQFEKVGWNISANLPFNMIGQNWRYSGNLSGQYAVDPLFGSEQISLGDANTVRGFRNSPVSGDSGTYFKNDISWKSPSKEGMLKGLSAVFGLDLGYVQAKNDNISNSGKATASLMGMAVGLTQSIYWAKHQQLDWSATLAIPLSAPSYVVKDSSVFYASLNWKFW
ncbi:MAG: ShlB/FhaC/HecB family hemolysin secretion/activation protein, partial [Gammaproteobacteria bacterium]|nr:ShlB/FhaC/HecB family hemolysin secretion/activation protein [Gammaproteobacteria bacterium]